MALAAPAELGTLREQLAELTDLHGAMTVLTWDQNTYMPPGGHASRAEQLATLERLAHARLVSSELDRLLAVLEPWAAGEDPDSDDARLVLWARRDHDKAARVPERLAVEMAREAAIGYGAWVEARETGDFGRFRDPLKCQLDLRHEYAACFPDVEHPYDALLDDFEPQMTLAQIRPLFERLVAALGPLVQAGAAHEAPRVLTGDIPLAAQRTVLEDVLRDLGFDPETWRLDATPHPFAESPGAGDVRITTRYRDDDLGYSFFSGLHEFGHGLYEAGFSPALRRSPLWRCASLGIHESQSRLWENVIGRSRAFAGWVLPRLAAHLPDTYAAMDVETFYRGLNGVRRSLIRTEADETTYNLHIALRVELELALMEDRLTVDELPAAWDEAMSRLIGVEVPSDRDGVLQDVHWATGMFGYFPTYTLGNLMAAQLWQQLRTDLPDVEHTIAAGDFGVIRDWLRDNIHRHGRKFTQRELLHRVTGQELDERPFVAYLTAKLQDTGVL